MFVFTEVPSQDVLQRDGCHYFLPINHQVNVGKLFSLPVRPTIEDTFFLDLYQLIEDRVFKHVVDRHNLQRTQQLALHWLGKPATYLDKPNLSGDLFKKRKHEVAVLLTIGAYEIIFTPGTCQKISVEVKTNGKRQLNFHFFKAFDMLDQTGVSANDAEDVTMRLQETEQERAEIIVSQVFPEVGARAIKQVEESLFANSPQRTQTINNRLTELRTGNLSLRKATKDWLRDKLWRKAVDKINSDTEKERQIRFRELEAREDQMTPDEWRVEQQGIRNAFKTNRTTGKEAAMNDLCNLSSAELCAQVDDKLLRSVVYNNFLQPIAPACLSTIVNISYLRAENYAVGRHMNKELFNNLFNQTYENVHNFTVAIETAIKEAKSNRDRVSEAKLKTLLRLRNPQQQLNPLQQVNTFFRNLGR